MSVCEYVCSGSPDFWNKLGFLADEKVAWSARYSSSSLHPLTFSQLFIPTPFFLFKEWGKKHALLLTAFKLSFNLSLSLSLYVVGEMRFHPSVSAKCCYVPEKTYIFFSASWVSLSVQLSNKICKRDNQFVWLDNCHMVILKTGLVFHSFHLLSSHIHCKVPWNYIWLNYKELFMLDQSFFIKWYFIFR